MHRSKLEMHIDILRVLADYEPLKLTHMMYKVNINCCALKDYLEFLIKQGLVEEKAVGKKGLAYMITQRGRLVVKAFEELKHVLPITEETPISY
jgi:predicted transcriptional regulator